MMWNSWGNMMGWGGGFGFGWIFMLVFWGLIIWGIVALVRGAGGHGCWGGHHHDEHGHKSNTALDILKERYAKGEISKEDFEKMKKDLE
jgi:putative membrane protein